MGDFFLAEITTKSPSLHMNTHTHTHTHTHTQQEQIIDEVKIDRRVHSRLIGGRGKNISKVL